MCAQISASFELRTLLSGDSVIDASGGMLVMKLDPNNLQLKMSALLMAHLHTHRTR